MNEARRLFQLSSLKAFDLAALILSFGLATILSASASGEASLVEVLSVKVKLWNFVIFLVLLALWHLIFTMCGLYKSKRLSTRWEESIDAAKGVVLASVSLMVASRFLRLRMFTAVFLIFFWACSTAILLLGRLVTRYLLARLRRQGRNLHFIVILGTNARAIEFARKIDAKPELGYRIVGFADDPWAGTANFLEMGYRLCCDLGSLPAFLRNSVVDEVALFLPLRSFYEDTA